MATKSLSIREEAYRRLKNFKQKDESFSDVIMKVTEGEKDFSGGFGRWEQKEDIEEVVEKGREKLDRDLRKKR
ncbi:MAG: antitoxin VapB family protein [Candidatus Nanohaloarchaea archaeon]